jgi:S1-C subfamily serine protease
MNEDKLDKEMKAAYQKIKKDLGSREKGNCPDEETLTSYIENKLSASEAEKIEKHLSLCDKCNEYVVVMNKTLHFEMTKELPDVPKEVVKKAMNLAREPKPKSIEDERPTLKEKITEWLNKLFPLPMPSQFALGTVVAVLLIFSTLFVIYRKSPQTGEERVYAPFDLSASLVGKSGAPAVRGAGKGSSGKVLIDEGEAGILHSGDSFQVTFKASQDAYIYVFIHDSKEEVSQLFPSPEIKLSNKVLKDNTYIIPSQDKWFWLDQKVGTETIYILATKIPIENTQDITSTLKTEGINKVKETLGSTLLADKTISFLHTDEELSENLKKIERETRQFKPQKAPVSQSEQELFNSSKEALQAFLRIRQYPVERKLVDVLERFSSGDSEVITRGAGGSLVYKKAAPGVVLVLAGTSEENLAAGSGAILDAQGHVITNWHVVKDVPEALVILKPPTGVEIRKDLAFVAQVIKVDALADLALLKIKNPPKNLTTLRLGSMQNVEVGQDVHAIGHPENEVWTYTKGIISQIRPNYEWEYEDGTSHKAKVIQTQTPINPGSSGSPLLNDQAEVIGINSFIKTGEGLNYAVSSDEIQEFMQRKGSRVVEKKPLWGDLQIKYYIEEDLNKNGKVDLVIVDVDGDKKPDVWIFDENEDNVPDYLGFDQNKNGKIDVFMRNYDEKGKSKVYEFDTNEDGTIELYGIDLDGDGKIDRYFRG